VNEPANEKADGDKPRRRWLRFLRTKGPAERRTPGRGGRRITAAQQDRANQADMMSQGHYY